MKVGAHTGSNDQPARRLETLPSSPTVPVMRTQVTKSTLSSRTYVPGRREAENTPYRPAALTAPAAGRPAILDFVCRCTGSPRTESPNPTLSESVAGPVPGTAAGTCHRTAQHGQQRELLPQSDPLGPAVGQRSDSPGSRHGFRSGTRTSRSSMARSIRGGRGRRPDQSTMRGREHRRGNGRSTGHRAATTAFGRRLDTYPLHQIGQAHPAGERKTPMVKVAVGVPVVGLVLG